MPILAALPAIATVVGGASAAASTGLSIANAVGGDGGGDPNGQAVALIKAAQSGQTAAEKKLSSLQLQTKSVLEVAAAAAADAQAQAAQDQEQLAQDQEQLTQQAAQLAQANSKTTWAIVAAGVGLVVALGVLVAKEN